MLYSKGIKIVFFFIGLCGLSLVLMLAGTSIAQNHTLPRPESIYLMLPLRPVVQPPTWPAIDLAPVADGLVQPTFITHAGDNSGRLFITEKPGRVRIISNGSLLPSPFLDISAEIGNNPAGEEGLLSIAFPSGFGSTTSNFYVFHTDQRGDLVIARYQLSGDPGFADPNSGERILTIPHPTFGNHNGGQLQFGPDGFLYVSTGDGGGGGDPFENSQNPAVLLGKLLRIDVESTSASSYSVPPTNPFVGLQGFREEIWALGLRNPWRFSFDRLTGDLYIGDVGQSAREEVNFQPATSTGGENYGWDILEGNLCFEPNQGCVAPSNYSPPITEYPHGDDCSVTGGYVYRGVNNSLRGIYMYGDACSGAIRGLQRINGVWMSRVMTIAQSGVSTFGEDQSGNLYIAEYFNGVIKQVVTR